MADILHFTALGITDVSTIGGSDGSITITASGGTAPYTYSIDGVDYQAENEFTGLEADDYTVFVKDFEDNIASFDVTISEPIPEEYVLVDRIIKTNITENKITADVSEPVLKLKLNT